MSKRKLSDLDTEPSSHLDRQPRLDVDLRNELDKNPVPQTLPYPSPTSHTSRPTLFQQPTPLLTFSYTPTRTLEFSDSALRYFVDPPRGAQLGYRYDAWVRRPEEKGRLDALLRAWTKLKTDGAGIDAGVVSWRGVMTKILTAPYEERDAWDLNVMAVGGTLYFEEYISNAKLQEKNDMKPRQRLQSYYGYAFESYCTSATPRPQDDHARNAARGWSGDVDTNVQWCSVVKTKLGSTRMIIGGEVDCVRGTFTGRTDTFVELKTSLAIGGQRDEARFEKKLLKFYFQSFLLGVPEIVVGFRTPNGQITSIQTFKTVHIPRLIRGKPGAWDPLLCLDWGSRFLSFLQDTLCASNDPRAVWRVRFAPGIGVTATLLDEHGVADVAGGEERVGFLPQWYWDEIQSCARAQDVEPGGASELKAAGSRNASEGAGPSHSPHRAPIVSTSSIPPGWQI